MAYKVLILGASYGSLLGTKLIMAGHDVTLVCRPATARLINAEGTVVRIRLAGEDAHREIRSTGQPGTLNACSPEEVDPASYDLVALAMQEPQYGAPGIRALMQRIAEARLPCLSIMNMPPLPFLRRFKALEGCALEGCYTSARVWDGFEPGRMTLCSPDPQAFRPSGEAPNVLHVGLPTNFRAAPFEDDAHTAILKHLEADIAAVRLDGQDVPVKLKVFASAFVPLAKWSMLLAGNYRCIRTEDVVAIREAVHGDIEASRQVYAWVDSLVRRLGAAAQDQVPFEKYAKAAESLTKPSSVARAVAAGEGHIERVDRLIARIGEALGLPSPAISAIVNTVDARLEANRLQAA